MCIYCGTRYYRKIYENHVGPIPKDEDGRPYDIHHIDGNRKNNQPNNLKCVSIQEHYDIHYSQHDWAACHKLGGRMKLPPEQMSELATLRNLARVRAGTHHMQRRPDGTSLTSDRVEAGTHNFLGGEISRRNNARRLAAKTHNFLGPEQNAKRVAAGSHNFLGKNNPSHARVAKGTHNFLNAVQNGTHPSQLSRTCEHCDKTIAATAFGRWHGNNCKLKN